jgi:hypothetical protein
MLRVFDGLDHYNVEADLEARTGFLQYALGGSAALVGWVAGVFGTGRAGQFTTAINATLLDFVFSEDINAAILGMRLQLGAESGMRFFFMDTAVTKLTVYFNPRTRGIEIWRGSTSGGTSLYRSANNIWSPMVSMFIEIKLIIDASPGGEVEVLLNGSMVAQVLAANTLTGTNLSFNMLTMQAASAAGSGTQTAYIDDFYYLDTTPGGSDSFLGDTRTVTLFPAANSAVTWTPLSGTNWEMIDEVSMDSDTTYNSSATVDQTDTFTFGALPASIFGVLGAQLTAAVRKDDGGAKSFAQQIDADVAVSHTSSLATTYSYQTDLWEYDPATNTYWLPAAVNAAVAGYKVAA